jgi:LexA-binding, inner membrane-associated putative hydrolase
MFIGHYALALAAKRAAPRTSLGTLFAATSFADLLWPVLLLVGVEHAHIVPGPNPFLTLWLDSIPISHSLIMLIGWGALFGLVYRGRAGDTRAGVVVALLVVSHWVLDWVTHRPDMPLYPGGRGLGLGLWNSVSGTVVTEGVMFLAGLWLYVTGTQARDGVGRYGFWALVAVLLLSYYGSLFSPPPTSYVALAIGGIIFGWLFVVWAGWTDRHRECGARRLDGTLPG